MPSLGTPEHRRSAWLAQMEAAAAAKVSPISAGTEAFSTAVNEGGNYLWAVGEDGELRLIRNVSDDIKHSVVFVGGPVRGAGNVEFSEGRVSMINDQSGHYFPWLEDNASTFLTSGVNALRAAGTLVPEEAIMPTDDF